MTDIASPQNAQIKLLVKLRDRKERQATGTFLIEGRREIQRALASGVTMERIYVCEELAGNWQAPADVKSVTVAPIAFAKAAVREGSDGLLAVAHMRSWSWDEVFTAQDEPPLILVCDRIEKPGNLGALMRSADGAGATGLVILDGGVDPYSPHVIRTSLGTIFSLKFCVGTTEEFLHRVDAGGVHVVAAALAEDVIAYHEADYTQPTALCLGSEAHGLPDAILRRADHTVKIPMLGIADSLNVSVSGALLLYEARRQRMRV